MLALSTAWNADRWQNGERIVKEILELGLRQIELNFSLTAKMVDEIGLFVKNNNISISSLHNYCPIPRGLKRANALPDCYSLSSLNEKERKKAVRFTKITIETAQRLCARAVVLHCGRVEMEDKTRALIKLSCAGKKNTQEYKNILKTFIRERKTKKNVYFIQILKSLTELCDFAQKHKIILGIENRFYYREIPVLEEFEIIFEQFKNGPIGYWHDVGHNYILEQLGFLKKGALLKKFGNRLCGFHLHNVKKLVDHQAPIDGEFDFRELKPYIRHDTINVIEAHNNATPLAIKKSIPYLEEIFYG